MKTRPNVSYRCEYCYSCISSYICMSLHTCCSCAHMYAHMPMPMVAFHFSAVASGVSMLQLRYNKRIVCSGCSAQTFVALLRVYARLIQSAWMRRKLCNMALKAPCFLFVACLYAGISFPAG